MLKPAPCAQHDVLDVMIRKFEMHTRLTDGDRAALASLPVSVRSAKAGTTLVKEGQQAQSYTVLLSGYAYRYKVAADGGRQVVSIQIPGEGLACASLFFDEVDHTTEALTGVEAAFFDRPAFRALVRSNAAISHSLLLMTLIEVSIANEWQLSLGRRDAKARVAHLLLELAAKLDAAGLANGGEYDLPLTQMQLADTLGLTPIHVNRKLNELRNEGLVDYDRGRFRLTGRDRLVRIADFSDTYLRLGEPKGH
jgi:CRP-like cAMP-binding protein